MESVSPIMLVGFLLFTSSTTLMDLPPSHLILTALWLGHYLYRALFYPFLMRWRGKHMPLIIMMSAVVFNMINGGLNGIHLAVRPSIGLDSLPFLAGAVLFVAGLAINIHSDAILRALRKPGETGYRIPQGGLFRWVSCPNYTGELLEWIGFAMMAATPAAFAFAVWTAANLIPRAVSHHRWYLKEFEMYPRDRKAVVPLVL